jgi:CRP-like cAMP-binding protein
LEAIAFFCCRCIYIMEINSTSEALTRYRKKMESFAPISDADFLLMANTLHEKQFDKGEVLLKEGRVCKQYYFILSGCIRRFGLENGREINLKFYFEDDLVSDFVSFRNEEPSQFYFVAMEDCGVYYATKAEAVPVFQSSSSLHFLLFRLFQDLFFKEEEHSNSFKLLSPEERYKFLIDNKPQYLQRIPLVYLASYLGVSRETLTRIRKKIS